MRAVHIHSVVAALAALAICSHSAQANPYAQCMLKNAPSIKDATPDGIDVIADACVKSTEEPLDSEERAKVQVNFLFGQMRPPLPGHLGLILKVHNGSAYDITSITVGITDKRTQTQRLHRGETWFPYTGVPASSLRTDRYTRTALSSRSRPGSTCSPSARLTCRKRTSSSGMMFRQCPRWECGRRWTSRSANKSRQFVRISRSILVRMTESNMP
jgi:hypothetical protein